MRWTALHDQQDQEQDAHHSRQAARNAMPKSDALTFLLTEYGLQIGGSRAYSVAEGQPKLGY
jgi:hypothetical protein